MRTVASTYPNSLQRRALPALVCGLLTLSWASAAVAADDGGSTSNAGKAGGDFARQLIQNTQAPSWDADGGRHNAGSFRINGQDFEIAEMAPGATKSTMEQAKARRVDEIHDLETEGISEYNRLAREEGAAGEAVRSMYDVSITSVEGHPDVEWLIASGAITNAVSQSFADCKTTASVRDGGVLHSTIYTSESCSEGPSSLRPPACGRSYEFKVIHAEVDPAADPVDPRCYSDRAAMEDSSVCPAYQVEATLIADSECAQAGAGCRQEFVCTAEGEFTQDGVTIGDDDFAGLDPLYPGAPLTCRAATARLMCPVCTEIADGVDAGCTFVDVAEPEGSTCQALRSDAACREVGRECILTDEVSGECLLTTRRFSCERPTEVPTSTVEIGNSCNIEVQCGDGSCNTMAGMDGEGMKMEEALARMAILDTLVSDMSYDEDALSGANGGQLTPAQQQAIDGIRMFKGEAYSCQKGYAGLVDCCGRTNSSAHELYWSIYQRVSKDLQAARLEKQGGTSAYQDWQQGNNTLSSLSNPFTSMRDNVMGGGSGRPDAVTMTVWQEFMARARSEIKPGLSPSWACKDNEFDLAIQREIDMCSYAGTYCSQRVLGACLKRRESHCCYQSPMSKALRESAEPGGVLNHGSAKNPDCDGIRIEDLDKVKWEAIDFTRLMGHMSEGKAMDKANDPANAASNYTGSGQAGGMAQGRVDVSTRSMDRLGSFDAGTTHTGIAEDAAQRDYRVNVPAESGAARLSFQSSSWLGNAGSPVLIAVTRDGTAGSASATVTVVGGSPDTVGFWSETIYWGAGDETTRYVRLQPPPGVFGEVILELQAHEGTVTGFDLIRVRIE